MWRNFLKIGLRNLLKHRLFSMVNILGLALGMTCVILISIYIIHEKQYDLFHANGDRIYRVLRVNNDETGTNYVSPTSAPYATGLANDFGSEFESVIRVSPNDGLVTYGEKSFNEKQFYLADANFFEFFSYPLIKGDPKTVLTNPTDVVLTEAMAKKYFGDEDPIGKIIRYDNQNDLKVTGIAGPFPGNSHLNFDFVANVTQYKDRPWFAGWWNNFLFTYVLLKPGLTPEDLLPRFPAFMDKYFGEDFKKNGRRMDLALEPLKSIYLSRETKFDLVPHGDKQTIFIFGGVSILVLLIAALNFMNLSTAKSSTRAKEVGLRKVVGADRMSLIKQFLGESILVAFMALGLALGSVELLLPYLNAFLEKSLSWTSNLSLFAPVFIGGTLLIGIIAGLYPAFILSGFKPVDAMKQKLFSGARRSILWKGVVVTQFSISIFLIIGTLTMLRQFDYVNSKSLGFRKDHVLLVELNNSDIRKKIESFKDQLRSDPGILSVSSMSGEPGGFHDRFGFEISGKAGESFLMRTVFSDFDYAKTFDLSFVSGRDFSLEFGTDKEGMLLNETAVRALGWSLDNTIGKKIKVPQLRGGNEKTVIGIVRDYHFSSLKEEIQPLAITTYNDNRVCAIKIKSDQVQETISKIEKAWMGIAPKFPMEYKFLDQSLELLYRNDIKESRLIIVFSVLAIIIACMGLFGLAAFSAEKRTKEIGVRKILGANIAQIVSLFTKEFVLLILASNVIAVPLAYFAMKSWLDNFAYRTDQTVDTFVMAGAITLAIALFTISFQAIKTSISNPVQALKYE